MKPFFSLDRLFLSGLFLLHDSCSNLIRDGFNSINSEHSCWLQLTTTPDPASPSSARTIHLNTPVPSHADSSSIKQGPYSEEACNHHHPPSTSCAYDTHLSRLIDSPIRPHNMESEVGARPYPQQGSQQCSTTPMVTFQHRTPSGSGLLHVGDEATPPPSRHAIKLMGVLMSPEVAPSSSDMPASVKHNENMFSNPSATVFLSQDHAGTGDVAAQRVISGQQDHISPQGTEWEQLKFDVSVFESARADDADWHKIRHIVHLINRLNRGGNLQMSTGEFRTFYAKIFTPKFLPASRDTTCKNDSNTGARKQVAACKALYEKKEFWFRRFAVILRDPRRLTALRRQLKHNTQNEAFALLFLFFVEMICVVVSPHGDEKPVNEQLNKALEILEELFRPTPSPSSASSSLVRLSAQASGSNHHSPPLHPPTSPRLQQYSNILTKLAVRDTFYVFPALWLLLQRWICTHRKLFAREIMPMRNTNIRHVKIFFNTIFYLSIHNLNNRQR